MKPTITFNEDTMSINLTLTIDDFLNVQEASTSHRGRPKSLSSEDQRLFLILMKVGASIDDVCTALSIGRATYFRYKKRLSQ